MSYTLKIRQNVAGWALQLFGVSASRLASTAASINSGLNILSRLFLLLICFTCSQLKSSTTLKNLSNWGLLKLAAVQSSSSLQTGLNSSLHKHPSCRDLSCCCYSSSDLPTTDSWTVLFCTVCSWIMNRLDQLTELRSKLQADWLFKFTETDKSKPVTQCCDVMGFWRAGSGLPCRPVYRCAASSALQWWPQAPLQQACAASWRTFSIWRPRWCLCVQSHSGIVSDLVALWKGGCRRRTSPVVATHSGLKWLKFARNKFTWSVFTKNLKQVPADRNNFRFQWLHSLYIQTDASKHYLLSMVFFA